VIIFFSVVAMFEKGAEYQTVTAPFWPLTGQKSMGKESVDFLKVKPCRSIFKGLEERLCVYEQSLIKQRDITDVPPGARLLYVCRNPDPLWVDGHYGAQSGSLGAFSDFGVL
jgi:hypothetical protein